MSSIPIVFKVFASNSSSMKRTRSDVLPDDEGPSKIILYYRSYPCRLSKSLLSCTEYYLSLGFLIFWSPSISPVVRVTNDCLSVSFLTCSSFSFSRPGKFYSSSGLALRICDPISGSFNSLLSMFINLILKN